MEPRRFGLPLKGLVQGPFRVFGLSLARTIAITAGEDRVCAGAPPDDVCLAISNLCAVLEGRTAVRRPDHLPNAGMALHPLDADGEAVASSAMAAMNCTAASRKVRCC
jgi:hypothetical protein